MTHLKLTCIFILSVILSVTIYGQKRKDTAQKDTTGTAIPLLIADSSVGGIDSQARMIIDTGTTNLVNRIEGYTQKLNKANVVLRRGFDTLEISQKLADFEEDLRLIGEFLTSRVGISNRRSLSLSKILLEQMERQLKLSQESLLKYSTQLVNNNELLQTISSDSILKALPTDSILRAQYYSQLHFLSDKWVEADTINKANLTRISYLQNRVSMSYLKVGDLLNIVNVGMIDYARKVFNAEYEFLWSKERKLKYDSSLYSSLSRSIRSNNRVFIYYTRSRPYLSLIFLIGGLLFYLWTLYAMSKIRKGIDGDIKLSHSRFISRDAIASAIIVTFTLAPFVYANPPMLYSELMMFMSLLGITWIAFRRWPRRSAWLWTIGVLLFLFYGAINLMVTTAKAERWIFLLVTILSIWYGVEVRRTIKSSETKIKGIAEFIVRLFIILQAISIVANLSGRYSLAKTCSITASFGLTQAFVIFYFIEILLEALYLQLESHGFESGIFSYFNYKDIEKKMRSMLTVIGVLIWSVITMRNLNVYDFLYAGTQEFLNEDRTLGSSHFTFWSIVVFIIIIIIASFLSRLIGFIFGNPQGSIKGISKGSIGSGVLLIRLGIYIVGFIVAFVASGIPLDKITLIIGALGVGIGFGLQNIVNNLVSGVILAFEKPIQIGDVIEVGTRIGIVNEIGIRSSKISTYEGSTVIIPNGDLIAQHIINWTHGNQNRRIEVLIGVAYGSDVNQCQDIIEQVIDNNKFIIHDPKPLILLTNFGNSSVDYRILFWTNNIGRWIETRSDVMKEIYSKFDEKGISLPFSQQDLHIRSIDPEVAKSLQGGK